MKLLGSHGAQCQDAQEKPDFPAHPNEGPEGVDGSDVPELSLKLPADMILVTFSLLHLLH